MKKNSKMDHELLGHARDMRTQATDAENVLWYHLRDRRLANAKFKRQQPIGSYIVDFCCDAKKLVVELDGGQHAEAQVYDEKRTMFLESQGYKVMRFWNNDVIGNIEGVVQVIADCVGNESAEAPSPLPLSRGEREKNEETGGPKGAEPTRFGDWEINGKCVDF